MYLAVLIFFKDGNRCQQDESTIQSSLAYLAKTINTDLFCSLKITKLNFTNVHYYTRLQSFFSLIYRAFEPMHSALYSLWHNSSCYLNPALPF